MSKQPADNTSKTMTLADHLQELRLRLILALVGLALGLAICLFFGALLLRFIARPYELAMLKAGLEPTLLAIHPTEKLIVYLKTCLLFGLIISSPWVFYQLWTFISAGLYTHEKKLVHKIVPASTALFIAGCLFFIKIVAPLTMRFFINFHPGISFVKVNFTLQNYVSFVVWLTLVFGLAFQMPIVILCMEKLGITSLDALKRSRKYVILLLVIVAALATPPDVISQIALAVPLYVLFEASVLACRLTRKDKN